MTTKILLFALLCTPFTLWGAGCAGTGAAVKPTQVEVIYQASTDISDNGTQINGKLCFDDTHFDVAPLSNHGGAIDLLGYNRHFVIGRVSPTENRIVGAIAGRGGAGMGPNSPPGSAPLGGQQENERALLGSSSGPAGTEEHEAVDLRFGADHLVGRVGWHQFSVHAVGDHLEGQYQWKAMNAVQLKFYGIDKLWALPLAEQGVLLPSLLHCLDKVATHDFAMSLNDLQRKL